MIICSLNDVGGAKKFSFDPYIVLAAYFLNSDIFRYRFLILYLLLEIDKLNAAMNLSCIRTRLLPWSFVIWSV